jgi:gliding motility-associated-like protein
MKLRIYIVILLILVIGKGFSQNLLPNSSFETYLYASTRPETAYPWYDPTDISSDYFSEDWNNNILVSPWYGLPNNMFGYQYSRTGKAHMHFAITLNNYNLREHIAIELDTSLVGGREYCVSMFLSLTDLGSTIAIDEISVLFLNYRFDTIVGNNSPLIGFTPQVTNLGGSVFSDTTNWVNFSGSFIANGDEICMIIGSFYPDSQISYSFVGAPTSWLAASYFIDDVAVYACDADVYVADGGGDVQLCLGDSVILGSHELGEYLYWWYDMQGNLIADSTGYITVMPQQTTQYELVVKDFKFEETRDTITVYVEDCFTDKIYVPNIFSPNGDGNNDILFVRSEYIESLNFKVYNRWGEMVFEGKEINEGWNGEYKGKRCDPSVFVWYLEAVMTNGSVVKLSGNVTLVR